MVLRLLSVALLMLVACTDPGQTLSAPEEESTTSTPAAVEALSTPTTIGDSKTPGPTETVRPIEVPVLAPIAGYGDFSHSSYAEVDWFLVTELQVQCANDEGIPVYVIPPGDGIAFDQVSLAQHRMAGAVLEACLAGLNLPPFEPLTHEQISEFYAKLLELKTCLEVEGFAIDDPPSADAFAESYYSGDVWHPYESVPFMSMEDWNELSVTCPQP